MDPKDNTAARQIIDIALRRVREGGGSYCADTPGAWRQQAPDLNVWLAPVSFAIIGGLATRLKSTGTDLLSRKALSGRP